MKTYVATDDSQRECWHCGMPEDAYAGAHALFPLGPEMPLVRVVDGVLRLLSSRGGGRTSVCLRCARLEEHKP